MSATLAPALPDRRRIWIGAVAAFLIQAGLLAAMVADRALLLARGTEIRLAVVPVDPRDLLRGDYVILSYPISRLRSDQVAGDETFAVGDTVYVTLGPEGGTWRADAMKARPPGSGLVLKGKIEGSTENGSECPGPCRVYRVAYNLEKFFVPEGKGRALERLRNDQRLEVDVAVAADGRAALKRLLVDGIARHEDPLF